MRVERKISLAPVPYDKQSVLAELRFLSFLQKWARSGPALLQAHGLGHTCARGLSDIELTPCCLEIDLRIRHGSVITPKSVASLMVAFSAESFGVLTFSAFLV